MLYRHPMIRDNTTLSLANLLSLGSGSVRKRVAPANIQLWGHPRNKSVSPYWPVTNTM